MTIPNGPVGVEEEDEAPEPVYTSIEQFVHERFLPMFRRPLGGEYRWCSRWWAHAEAISRLTALWYSWETLRLEPGTGMAVWYRDYLDHQMPILMGPRGPFFQCSEDEHNEPREARAEPSPPGYWDDPLEVIDETGDDGADTGDQGER